MTDNTLSPVKKIRISAEAARWIRRSLFVVAAGIILFDIGEHYLSEGIHFDLGLIIESLIIILVMVVAGTRLLRKLESLERGQHQMLEELTSRLEFSRQLSLVDDWDQLTHQVAKFPASILPIIRSHFHCFNPDEERYTETTAWEKGVDDAAPTRRTPVKCQYCMVERGHFFHRLVPMAGEEHAVPKGVDCFCLPLTVTDRHMGVIQMQLPLGYAVETADELVLNGAAIELAFAVDRARLDRMAAQRDAAAETETNRIARDLHDTLGQNVAYLRLKLDEMLMEENPDQKISSIHNQLDQMRRIADEAYTQVRRTLSDLRPSQNQVLARLLLRRAREVGQRAGFEVAFDQVGVPQTPVKEAQQQTVYICREALNNIEKHAKARRVNIQLDWQPRLLTLRVQDDGKGFDPEAVNGEDHYGLAIMRERAKAAGGSLEVRSSIGGGTTILLAIPLDPLEGSDG